ncbi:MAG: PAS domain S-box protein [Stygiobacter sp.]
MDTKNQIEESERMRKALLSLIEDQKLATQKLKESEQLFRSLAESTSSAIFIYKNEKFIYVNKSTEILTGYTAEELYSMHFWDVIHPDFKEIVKQRGLARQRGEDVPTRYEFKIIKKNGEEAWIDFSASKIIWKGEPAAIGSAFDITERKKGEELLKQSEKQYRLIAENTADTIAVFDMNLQYTYVSPSVKTLLGYSPEEVMKIGLMGILTKESLKKAQELYEQEMAIELSGKGDPNRSFIFSSNGICKDGRIIDLESTVSIIRDTNGNAKEILTVSRDVTEKNKLKKELQEREERMRLIVEGTPNFFFYTQDNNGILTYVSPTVEQITGYKPEEWYNQKHWFATENVLNKNATVITHKHLKGETSKDPIYFELYHRNGNKVLLEIYENPIVKSGKVVGLQGIATDITVKKKREIIQKIQYNIANAVVTSKSLNELFEVVRSELAALIDTKNFFIAFYDEKSDTLKSNIDKDEKDEIPEWPAEKSLTGYVIKTKHSQLLNKEDIISLYKNGVINLIGTLPESWLGVPLIIGDKVIGAIAVQDYYNKNAYDEHSLEVLEIISKQLSVYIEQKRAEEKILKLTIAIEQSPASIIITNTDGIIEYVNKKFCEITGYSLEEVIGKNPRFLKSGVHDKSFYKELWDTIKSGNIWKRELCNKKKDGSLFWEGVIISPVIDESGNISNFVAIKEDITDKKKLNDKLVRSEEEFRSVWENSADAMRLIDEEGIIINVNEAFCKMFDLTKEELIGKPFDVCYTKGNHISKFKERYITNSIPKKLEVQIELYNHKKIWIDVTNSKLELKDNPPLLLSIFRDITDKKKLIEELITAKEKAEEMNRVKSHFFATMSHELRTPFVGIMGFAEILYDEIENQEYKEMAGRIIQASKRLTNTLNQILNMTKLEFDKQELYITNFDAVQILEDVYLQFEKTAKIKNLDLRKKFKLDSFFIDSDEKLVSEILINLVNNAIKYTDKGWVEIYANKKIKNKKEYFVVEVRDSGIGIPKEKQELIWEDFRQASEGTSRKYEGTGLGLSIAKRFAEVLKANLYLKESVSNVGSVFVLEIPIENESVKEKAVIVEDTNEDQEFKAEKISFQKKKILYVEDEQMAIDIVKRSLSNNYEIDCVTNVKDTLEKVNDINSNYDLIFMDINLGHDMLDGIQLTAEIRKIDKYKNVPIVALTAYASEDDKNEFLSKGMDYYLSKPFTISDLRKLVNDIFNK